MFLSGLLTLSAVTVDKPTGFLGALATGAEDFIKVFNKGGSVLLSLMGGILPTLIVLLTAVNALVRIIGAERIENLGKAAARPGIQWYPVRYILHSLPYLFSQTLWHTQWVASSQSALSQRSMTQQFHSYTQSWESSLTLTQVSFSYTSVSQPVSRNLASA